MKFFVECANTRLFRLCRDDDTVTLGVYQHHGNPPWGYRWLQPWRRTWLCLLTDTVGLRRRRGLGAAGTRYVQDISRSRVCKRSPAHLLTASYRHTEGKHFCSSLCFFYPPQDQRDHCAMHAADCEIRHFMSHYLKRLTGSGTAVKRTAYLSVF